MDQNTKKFQFPKALLNQINECSKGFMLFAIDESGHVQVYESENMEQVSYLGLVNFMEIYSASLQTALRSEDIGPDNET
jgi:Ca2+-binding EF-hand superfamily protein